MIDYTLDIVDPMFNLISSDPEYQTPDPFDLQPTWAVLTPAKKRLLMFIELFRAYMADIEDVHEAELVMEVGGQIENCIKLGARLAGDNANRAQFLTLHFLAARFRM